MPERTVVVFGVSGIVGRAVREHLLESDG